MATTSSPSLNNNNNSVGGLGSSSSSRRLSSAMERTGQWYMLFSQEIPSDVIIQVGEAKFPLHKFILLAKSGYIRKMIMESITEGDLSRIDLSDIPGGSDMFEKAAKFCYGVNFEINVHNVAPLHCAADYLEMTESYCEGNLVGRTEEFLSQVALKSLSGAIAVLVSCQQQQQHNDHHLLLFSVAQDLNIIQRCLDAASLKACNEANFPSRSPANWWMEELSKLDVNLFKRLITCMKARGVKTNTVTTAIQIYTENSILRDLIRNHSSGLANVNATATTTARSSSLLHHFGHEDVIGGEEMMIRKQQRNILEAIVSMLPYENGSFPVTFLCYLLRSALFLEAETNCKNELEKRLSTILEHVAVDDMLVLSFSIDGEKLFGLESVRRIITLFVNKEKSVAVFNGGAGAGAGAGGVYNFKAEALAGVSTTTVAMQKVAKMVDAYLGEIATYPELSISKFNGIANLVPKEARKVDDNLYRSIDIYLKAHPGLDEIEREKICSMMDPLKLSYEARVHASQNKRLPVQIVLHTLYFDQLNLRSGAPDDNKQRDAPAAVSTRKELVQSSDVLLRKENEVLRTELMKMKQYVSDLQNNNKKKQIQIHPPHQHHKSSNKFFSTVSKKLGKLNPFRHGSKDTSNIIDEDGSNLVDLNKPRRRRFSIS